MAITEQIFRRLGEVAEEVIFVFNLDTGLPAYISPAIARFNVSTPEQLNNPDSWLNVVHEDDRAYVKYQLLAFLQQGKLQADFRVTTKEGTPLYVELTVYMVAENERLAIGWLRDVDVVKKNIFYAESINAQKNSLLEILSHDLKEPVGMISMMAGAIKKNPDVAGNEAIESYVQVIQELCDSNIKLIRSLVEDEFRGARDISLRIERANLVIAVEEIMKRYKDSATVIKKNIEFTTDVPHLYLLMDTLKMIQVVNNLISNAIKFTDDGGKITVALSDKGSIARITVSDDGIGIPADLQPYLFEPHSRAQRPGVRGEPGSGMGLSIIKKLVDLHGGRIWIDTQVQAGTTVHIELPKEPPVAIR